MKKLLLLLSIFVSGLAFSQSDCSNSQAVNFQVDGTVTVNSGGVSGTAVTSICSSNTNFYDETEISASYWYKITTSQDLVTTVFADAQNYIPSFNVYEGSCTNLTCVGADLITVDADENIVPAEVEFLAEAGKTYYIVFDDYYVNVPAPDGPVGTTDPFNFDVTTSSNLPNPPAAVINPDPADGSTVFLTQGTDDMGNTVNQYEFNWDLPASSDAASSYTFDLGVDNTVSDFSTDVTGTSLLLSGLALDTTYFWRITSNNPGGSTQGSVYTFTTEATLSADDFEKLSSFEFFINNELLNITANQSFDQINIFDLSGKQIMDKELSSNDENISIQGLANGLYLAKVQIGDQTKTFKFIK